MPVESVSLNVKGMSCSHCVNSITMAVGALNGVKNVTVDLDSERVMVEFDADVVSVDIIKGTIDDEGYDVK